MIFYVMKAKTMNMAVFWVKTLSSPADLDRRFKRVYNPDDGGSKLLRNVGPYQTSSAESLKFKISIRAIIVLMMGAGNTCETLVDYRALHETAIFVFRVVWA